MDFMSSYRKSEPSQQNRNLIKKCSGLKMVY